MNKKISILSLAAIVGGLLLFRLSGLMPLKALAALMGWGGAFLFCFVNLHQRWGQAMLAGLLAFAVYVPVELTWRMNTGDSFWYVPTAMSLLAEGNLELSEFRGPVEELVPIKQSVKPFDSDRRIEVVDGKVYNYYNLYTGIVSAPLVAFGNFWYRAETQPIRRALLIGPLVAKVFAALSVALVFWLALSFSGSVRQGALIAFVFALASPHFPNHAGGLWSHNVGACLMLLALMLVVVKDGRWIAWSAVPAALTFMMRAEMFLFVLMFTCYVLVRERRRFALFALAGGLMALLFFVHSHAVYGHFLPPKHAHGGTLGQLYISIPGLMISPNRGLLIFCPVLIFSVWGMFLLRSWKGHPLLSWLAGLAVAHWLFLGLWGEWWGGWSYGPRFFAMTSPLWCLMLLPAIEGWQGLGRKGLKQGTAILFALCLGFTLWVSYRGATSLAVHEWNNDPVNVDLNNERLWDWNDMQFLRGL
jgi:hypothetical protein